MLRGCSGDGVSLRPLFWHHEGSDMGKLCKDVRLRLLSMLVQVWWRFELRFQSWPFLLFKGCLPGQPFAYEELNVKPSTPQTPLAPPLSSSV